MTQAPSDRSTAAHEDADLRALREAPTDEQAARQLRAVLITRVRPIVDDVMSRRMRDQRDRQEIEDLCHDVLLQLLLRLHRVRDGEPDPPIADLGAYAAVTAERACSAHLRRKFPERTRLKNRIRYVLSRHAAFRLFDETGEWMCALSSWPAARTASGAEKLQALRAGNRANAAFALGGDAPASLPLPELIARLLRFVGGPVELDDLVSTLVPLVGVSDMPAAPAGVADEDGPNWWDSLADATRPLPQRLDDRAFLAAMWAELRELPVRQRAALLLNLRDNNGHEMTSLLPLVGTATVGEIAGCLEMGVEEFTAVWPRLPLDDLAIAAQLGITRQQVINLRKSARDRLARRLRGWRA